MMRSPSINKGMDKREEIASEPRLLEEEPRADWTEVKGVSSEVANTLYAVNLKRKEDLLFYFASGGIQALTELRGVGMKTAQALVAYAQRG